MLIHYYQLKYIIYLDFLCFYLMSFSYSRIPYRTPHHIELSCLLGLFLAVIFSHTFLAFDDLDNFEEYQSSILQNVSLFGFASYFPHDQTEVMSLWQEYQRRKAPFSLHHAVEKLDKHHLGQMMKVNVNNNESCCDSAVSLICCNENNIGSSTVGHCSSLTYPHHSFRLFEHFLTFWQYKMLQAYIVYSLPGSQNLSFL